MPGMKTHKTRSNDLSISVKLWRGVLMQTEGVAVGACSSLREHKLGGCFMSLTQVVGKLCNN